MTAQPGSSDDREKALASARQRLAKLEAEAQRLRAQLAQLDADSEQAKAVQLEAKLEQLVAQRTSLGEQFTSASETPTASATSKAPNAEAAEPANAKRPATRQSKPTKSKKPSQTSVEPSVASEAKNPAAAVRSVAASQSTESEPRRKRRSVLLALPGWAVSLCVHAMILPALLLITFATMQEVPHELYAGAPDGDEFMDEFTEVDLSPLDIEPTELEENELEMAPTDFSELPPSELDNPLESMALGQTDLSPGPTSLMPTDASSLMMSGESGGGKDGSTGKGKSNGGGSGGTQFFGARSMGNRFVFVVDNSGSMIGGRMETTLMELQRAIFAMSPEQEFYVIFFSDQVYPMMFPQSVDKPLAATPENKQLLASWLPTVETCSGGQVVQAMRMAADMEPSAVYLLSDGAYSSNAIDYLSQGNGWEFPIHTLGMTTQTQEHQANLYRIAIAHSGVYRPVVINPVAARMARSRPIPRHMNGPGPVWGTKVRKR